MQKFDSVLVANRGEIAVRVIRSAQRQGYRAIAVYSEADANALHVQVADEAVYIGPAPVKESYLDMQKILAAAQQTGAQAIHPGYGFLSENAEFSKACEDAEIVFIGPSAESIDLMGNKAAAKRLMLSADVPCIPGYEDEDQNDDVLLAAALQIGVPIMVKAAAGGGGRGMRLVRDFDDLSEAIESARSEALNAFGSEELILEKAIMNPRHVEIQVFGDSQGKVLHFGERDCSVQRRHQKVVEEAPCPVMTPDLREAMGQAAINAAKNINYVGAGTVEFLLDSNNNFYFLEMNTRLQVEHPVTEMVTGLDLVALQFQVAQGNPLPLEQDDINLNGHAIEVRLYAEDPSNDFLPETGTAHVWQAPEGEGIRVDSGILEGQEVSPFYDPMLAKIIAWGDNRDIARHRLITALKNTSLLGIETNKEFLVDVLSQGDFAAGQATTGFIAEHFPESRLKTKSTATEHLLLAACLLYRNAQVQSQGQALGNDSASFGWRNSLQLDTPYRFALDTVEGSGTDDVQTLEVYLSEFDLGRYVLRLNDESVDIDLIEEHSGSSVTVAINGVNQTLFYTFPGRGQVALQSRGVSRVITNLLAFHKGDTEAEGSGTVTAPMHGNVLSIAVELGDVVEAGQTLAILEAMKMEHRIIAEVAGTVTGIAASAGTQISAGGLMIEIEEASS